MNGKFYEYASAKRIQASSNIFLSKKFGERGGSLVAKSGNGKGDFLSPEPSPNKDLDGIPLENQPNTLSKMHDLAATEKRLNSNSYI